MAFRESMPNRIVVVRFCAGFQTPAPGFGPPIQRFRSSSQTAKMTAPMQLRSRFQFSDMNCLGLHQMFASTILGRGAPEGRTTRRRGSVGCHPALLVGR
jgi:hypothetical protein